MENYERLLIDCSSLFQNLQVIEQEFEIIPKGNHFGLSVASTDLIERREDFVEELVDTVVDWVFSKAEQEDFFSKRSGEGDSLGRISEKIVRNAKKRFRTNSDPNLIKGHNPPLQIVG